MGMGRLIAVWPWRILPCIWLESWRGYPEIGSRIAYRGLMRNDGKSSLKSGEEGSPNENTTNDEKS